MARGNKYGVSNEEIVWVAHQILAADHPMTSRQLWYQLVVRGTVPNVHGCNVNNFSRAITDARLDSVIPWSWIYDADYDPTDHGFGYDGQDDFIESCIRAAELYKPSLHEGQNHLIEVFTEKNALASPFARALRGLPVELNIMRGYRGLGAACYEASKRIKDTLDDSPREVVVLYFGDHDPSGRNIPKVLEGRLRYFDLEFTFEHVALTGKQARQYHLAPIPAKTSDTRTAKFIKEYRSDNTYELDALPPAVLRQIILDAVVKYVDLEQLADVERQGADDRWELTQRLIKLKPKPETRKKK